MKQVRLFLSAAGMLVASLLLADHGGTTFRAVAVTNHSNNLTLPRSSASLAIDTYGYFDIRVWIDGVLINRRPLAYVEIPNLRAGHRLVDIEVIGDRGSRIISQTMYIQPYRWNLYEVQRGHRGWMTVNAVYTQPMGYYYVGGRRQSVSVGYRPPVIHHGVHINVHQHGNKKGNHHSQNHIDGFENRDKGYQRDQGRENGRGGNYPIERDDQHRQPRGSGSRSGGN